MVSADLIGIPRLSSASLSARATTDARSMPPLRRQELSVAALAGVTPLSRLAEEVGVSRKFVATQRDKAQAALAEAFAAEPADDQVLCQVSVTRLWLRRFVVAAMLIGHASDRDVQELAEALLGRSLSLGTIHNILHQAADEAGQLNRREDLSTIRVGALDEIYECQAPTLVGVDLDSTYCFLLSPEDHCDADTWGVRLLELAETHHLHLERSLADGGKGLRAGLELASPGQTCDYDHFHALRMFRDVVQYAENRAWAALRLVEKLKGRKDRTGRRAAPTPAQQAAADAACAQAMTLADDLAVLYEWMRIDVLGLAGESLAVREELLDFILGELRARIPLCAHRLAPLVKTLQNHRQALLGFAGVLDRRLAEIALDQQISLADVREVCRLEALDKNQSAYWQRQGALLRRLGGRLDGVRAAVRQAMTQTPRASSLVENLNGRLRSYFYLWRGTSRPYLDLLRFYLNHRQYTRSHHPERVGKSPYELLRGQPHPFWLDMLLGDTSISRN
jgi:hypothetical protein